MRITTLSRSGTALSALLLTLSLAACGGGGDSGATTTDGGTTTGTTGGGSTSASTGCDSTDLSAAMIAAVNARRASAASCGSSGSFAAAGTVAWSTRLASAALGHATDIAAQGVLSHTGSNGSTLVDRLASAGYGWSAAAENIASGSTTVGGVVTLWMDSAGHCANLMGSAYTEIGAACARSAGGTPYWVLVLARPR
jgi:uncharacterized protein YkwD